MKITESHKVSADRDGRAQDRLKIQGRFFVERWHGNTMISKEDCANLVTDEGVKQLLEIMFRSGTQITAWYFGLIDDAGIGAGVAVTDVMASHAGWAESAAYTEANRQAWSPGAASGTGAGNRLLTNGTPAVFSMNTNGTNLYGFFITSNNTKSGTSGKLFSTVAFATIQPFNNGDTCKLTYNLNG